MFAGVKVVELAQWVFVPVAGALLADWGAEVLKIEHPQGGDGYRGLVVPGAGGGDVNYAMEMANHSKRSVAIDLKTPEGRDVLLCLIADTDVFLTNYLPSVLERLGLTVEALRAINPRLIYARGHGYGVRGPDADRPGYDATAFWARGAVEETLAPEGLPHPLPQRGAVGDRYAATHLAFGIAAALFRRSQDGVGSVVDVSLLSTAMWMMGSDLLAAMQGTFRPSAPLGSRRALPNPLAANYRCADDRWLSLVCLQPDKYWSKICAIVQRPDLEQDARFATTALRATHAIDLEAELAAEFARRPLTEWGPPLNDADIPWAPFQRIDELLDDPQVEANGYVGSVTRSTGESFPLPAGVVQFDEQTPQMRSAPALGADTDEVLLALGYDWDQIVALKLSGAIL